MNSEDDELKAIRAIDSGTKYMKMDTSYRPFAVRILQYRWSFGFSLPVINAIVSVCMAAISPVNGTSKVTLSIYCPWI